eukprot:CAMPEP_0201510098 /NCGR_PEP_ID=MMETSP0161_2-20130828/2934_1 /ASSEMBLY_ACC=CAM_ASM_000251 /TAXON_ID=180227 /ORGANISM="Neoparamoeba aestuarina, Strain SoJaBio B1-5/56/2" /LENGTH=278 /DNA_ID=CAMNT_0047905227 /DNA_START=23 /DNA_END=862 /DNA_ORIENTATION=-
MATSLSEEQVKECMEYAVELAKIAGEKVKKAYGANSLQIDFKGEIDLVTSVDKEVETLIQGSLKEKYPDHLFLGEESASEAGGTYSLSDAPTWVIDPIDGTTNFVHGLPFVSISIALVEKKKTVCGVILNPILNDLFTSQRGKGAFLNGNQIKVAQNETLNKAVISTNSGYDRTEAGIDFMLENQRRCLQQHVRSTRSLGSSATELSWVACGRLDAFYEFGVHAWDVAAAVLMVEEAGGICVHPSGEELDLCGRKVLGGNKKLVEQMSSVLSSAHPKH